VEDRVLVVAASERILVVAVQGSSPSEVIVSRLWKTMVHLEKLGEIKGDEQIRIEIAELLGIINYRRSVGAKADLAVTLLWAERPRIAVELFEESLPELSSVFGEDHPGVLELHAGYANALSRSGRLQAAEREMRRIYERRSALLGREHSETLRTEFLLRELRNIAVHQRVPLRHVARADEPAIVKRLADLLVSTGRVDEAESWLRRAADRGEPEPVTRLADLLVSTGRVDEAMDMLRPKADRGEPKAVTRLADLLVSTGRVDEAMDMLRPKADRGESKAVTRLADLFVSVGRVDEAESWLRRAADRGDSESVPRLADLLVSTGRVDEAESWLRRAADRGEPEPVTRLADLLVSTGRVDEAESWLRRTAR
jgi:thioredoxin-like negative regulator of GroEL